MSQRSPNRLLIVAFVALGVLVASMADADVIHLKNGRTLLATETEVQGDELVFVRNGTRAEIPMALVDRVEESVVVPEPLASEGPEVDPAGEAGTDAIAAGDDGDEADDEEGVEVPPEQTREYWQAAMLAIEQEKQQLQDSLVELRREERAFLFSHRSTAETRAKIEAVNERMQALDEEKQALRREARRLQIPPGWLRVTLPRDGW